MRGPRASAGVLVSYQRTHTRDDGVTEIEVTINVIGWGSSGSYWEPPEGMEIEIDKAVDLETGAAVTLTQAEAERIELDFHENPPEADYDEPDDF